MIYDKLTVALLGTLASESRDSTNAHIARYLLSHQDELEVLSVKALAQACNVGTGTVSRFCREVGFADFDELRQGIAGTQRTYEQIGVGDTPEVRGLELCAAVSSALGQAVSGVDWGALDRLVGDLLSYERISVFGMLKAQAAAVDLQVDLLMQGICADTCVSHAEQLDRIAKAGSDELVVVFSYTGSYFDAHDLTEAMRRVDRPKIWVVCGRRHQLPPFVADRLLFTSSGSQAGHPYQLELVAGLIAQELVRRQG